MPGGGGLRFSEFEALSRTEAVEALLRCVAIPRWAEAVVAGRPYPDRRRLLESARGLSERWTWCEVARALQESPFFDPRAEAAALQPGRRASGEVAASSDLQAVSTAYAERFGRSLIVGGAGRTSSDVLRQSVRRLLMDEESDRAATTAELREISLRRLRRMIG